MNEEEIRLTAILSGNDEKLLHVVDQVLQNKKLFKDNTISVLDTDGNPLVLQGTYFLNGQKVRIENAEFGSGNFLDTWYWVWYLDQNFEKQRITIDAKYPQGVLGGAVYQSKFIKA